MSNKRMIYIWDRNLEAFDSLENKSEFVNKMLLEIQNPKRQVKEHNNSFQDKIDKLNERRSQVNRRTE